MWRPAQCRGGGGGGHDVVVRAERGSGKSTLGENLMTAILGEDKMMETDKVDMLLGPFADLRGKLLVTFNEAKGKDTFELDSLLKGAITKNKSMVQLKNVQHFKAKFFDR